MRTNKDALKVECNECDHQFVAEKGTIEVHLDEQCYYNEDGSIDDCYWVHDYEVHCPTCNENVFVEILDPHTCCLT